VKGENEEMPLLPLKSAISSDLTVEGLLLGIVHALVDDRSGVQVTSKTTLSGRIFQVSVAASDVGKIIGKNGRTATAIRGLQSAMGIAVKKR
jgi:uncharacterized protein